MILEAFARRLHRRVTAADAGLTADPAPDADTGNPDTVKGLITLGSADMDPSRRSILTAGLYSVVLTVPGWPDGPQDAADRFGRVGRDPHTRIGHREVEAVAAMTEKISELDDQFGGRTARPMAAAFLVNTIVP
ncbi:hypothetical protein LO772_30865 [Yinghuangia sp. ASG 101]|uniref:hypothetical protein n=1 Tax=Yinghuangia sp. ASG 101 TaxID=2896848 RepID=UPI001E2AFF60|nr:hypothetical protein [Yinghuangia sp. ASG 101]UGQ11158.1 hypothetical protein LO772_30865 [Yinghuangia sp. ASG 101]